MRRTRLAKARKAAGFTQEALAELLQVDYTTVGRWENQARTPQPSFRQPLANALGVSLAELDQLLTVDPNDNPPAPARTGRVGTSDVDVAEDLFQMLQRLDQQLGGAAQYNGALSLIARVENMLTRSMKEHARWELSRKIGWIHSFAGWVAADSGQLATARQHFRDALHIARTTNDQLGLCRALYQSGRVELQLGDSAHALTLFHLGFIPAKHIKSNAFTACFLANSAWATSANQSGHVDRLINEAKEAFNNIIPGDEQGSILEYVGWSDILACTAQAWINVGRADMAIADAHEGIQQRTTQTRSLALENATLARAYFIAGDRQQASKAGNNATSYCRQTRSARLTVRMTELRRQAQHASADDLVAAIDDAL